MLENINIDENLPLNNKGNPIFPSTRFNYLMMREKHCRINHELRISPPTNDHVNYCFHDDSSCQFSIKEICCGGATCNSRTGANKDSFIKTPPPRVAMKVERTPIKTPVTKFQIHKSPQETVSSTLIGPSQEALNLLKQPTKSKSSFNSELLSKGLSSKRDEVKEQVLESKISVNQIEKEDKKDKLKDKLLKKKALKEKNKLEKEIKEENQHLNKTPIQSTPNLFTTPNIIPINSLGTAPPVSNPFASFNESSISKSNNVNTIISQDLTLPSQSFKSNISSFPINQPASNQLTFPIPTSFTSVPSSAQNNLQNIGLAPSFTSPPLVQAPPSQFSSIIQIPLPINQEILFTPPATINNLFSPPIDQKFQLSTPAQFNSSSFLPNNNSNFTSFQTPTIPNSSTQQYLNNVEPQIDTPARKELEAQLLEKRFIEMKKQLEKERKLKKEKRIKKILKKIDQYNIKLVRICFNKLKEYLSIQRLSNTINNEVIFDTNLKRKLINDESNKLKKSKLETGNNDYFSVTKSLIQNSFHRDFSKKLDESFMQKKFSYSYQFQSFNILPTSFSEIISHLLESDNINSPLYLLPGLFRPLIDCPLSLYLRNLMTDNSKYIQNFVQKDKTDKEKFYQYTKSINENCSINDIKYHLVNTDHVTLSNENKSFKLFESFLNGKTFLSSNNIENNNSKVTTLESNIVVLNSLYHFVDRDSPLTTLPFSLFLSHMKELNALQINTTIIIPIYSRYLSVNKLFDSFSVHYYKNRKDFILDWNKKLLTIYEVSDDEKNIIFKQEKSLLIKLIKVIYENDLKFNFISFVIMPLSEDSNEFYNNNAKMLYALDKDNQEDIVNKNILIKNLSNYSMFYIKEKFTTVKLNQYFTKMILKIQKIITKNYILELNKSNKNEPSSFTEISSNLSVSSINLFHFFKYLYINNFPRKLKFNNQLYNLNIHNFSDYNLYFLYTIESVVFSFIEQLFEIRKSFFNNYNHIIKKINNIRINEQDFYSNLFNLIESTINSNNYLPEVGSLLNAFSTYFNESNPSSSYFNQLNQSLSFFSKFPINSKDSDNYHKFLYFILYFNFYNEYYILKNIVEDNVKGKNYNKVLLNDNFNLNKRYHNNNFVKHLLSSLFLYFKSKFSSLTFNFLSNEKEDIQQYYKSINLSIGSPSKLNDIDHKSLHNSPIFLNLALDLCLKSFDSYFSYNSSKFISYFNDPSIKISYMSNDRSLFQKFDKNDYDKISFNLPMISLLPSILTTPNNNKDKKSLKIKKINLLKEKIDEIKSSKKIKKIINQKSKKNNEMLKITENKIKEVNNCNNKLKNEINNNNLLINKLQLALSIPLK